jgi:hypothetical protein
MTAGGASDAAAVLRRAVAAHRAGRRTEARAGYDAILAADPGHGWANYFRSLIADDDQDAALALACLRRATASPDPPVQALVSHGNRELGLGNADAALTAFEAAAQRRPTLAAAFTGQALALKRLGRLSAAAAAGMKALQLRRGWRPDTVLPPGELDPGEVAEMRRANRAKLRHDADQLRHLHGRSLVDDACLDIAASFDRLAADLFPAAVDETAVATLDDPALAATRHAYNRLLYLPEPTAPAGPVLAAGGHFADADRAFVQGSGTPVVIDDVLSAPVLERLQDFCREATIWFEVKDHGGHLGAYFEEGLACPLMLAVEDALRKALPRSLHGLQLAQLWAYKHAPGGSGTDLHADIGTVSANLWIAPDGSSLDPAGGGIEIWPVRKPDDWSFREANVERDGIRARLARAAVPPAVIPHRCNRLVLFDSRLFHRTAPGRFATGYANRRVNITFLYGPAPAARIHAAGCVGPTAPPYGR